MHVDYYCVDEALVCVSEEEIKSYDDWIEDSIDEIGLQFVAELIKEVVLFNKQIMIMHERVFDESSNLHVERRLNVESLIRDFKPINPAIEFVHALVKLIVEAA